MKSFHRPLTVLSMLLIAALACNQPLPTPTPTALPTAISTTSVTAEPTQTSGQNAEEIWNSPQPTPDAPRMVLSGKPLLVRDRATFQVDDAKLLNGMTTDLDVDFNRMRNIVSINASPTLTITVVENQSELIVVTGPNSYTITSESNWKMNAALFCTFSAARKGLDLTNKDSYNICIALGVSLESVLEWPRMDDETYIQRAAEVVPSEYILFGNRKDVLAVLYSQGITKNPLSLP